MSVVVVSPIHAQQLRFTGRIIDSLSKNSLSDVMVRVSDGSAVLTDSSGNFTLLVQNNNDTIFFSLPGYQTKSFVFRDLPNPIELASLNKGLDAVVVTALGLKRSTKTLGYATQAVAGNALETVKGTDVGTSLTGMVSGLSVKNSTEFNTTPSISIRGESPLLVIDGVPFGNMSLRDIPTDDIANIDVLKGPTAAALYGNRGSAGALMVTTKKGSREGLAVDFNTNNMMTMGYVAIPKVQTSYGHGLNGAIYTDYVWGPKLDIGDSAEQWNPITKEEEMMPLVSSGKNNLRNFMQTGMVSNTNISVTQTGKNGFFRSGLNYIYNKGQWPNSTLKIVNYTMSGQMRVGKKFDLESRMTYTWEYAPQNWGSGYSAQGYLYQILMWTGPDYDLTQYKDYWVTENEEQNWLYTDWYDNPYLIAYEKLLTTNKNKLSANLTANYSFTKDLKLTLRSGYDHYSNELTVRNPAGIYSTRGDESGTFSWSWSNAGLFGQDETWGYSTTSDLILSYNKKVKKFNFDALAGGTIYYYQDREMGAQTVNGLSVAGWYSLANAAPSTTAGVNSIDNNYNTSKKQVNSVYEKLSTSYDNGIFVDFTGRTDWSSTQSASQRAYFYPSLAGSVLLSRYLKLPDVISQWNVRGSWTISKTPADIYDNNRTYSTGTAFGLVTSSYPTSLLSADLKPSTTRTWEIGTAASFFNRRLNLDIAYFNKYYYNNQTTATISYASGFSTYLLNTKETYVRRGMEVTLSGDIIRSRRFSWNSVINYSFNHEYYVDLDPVYSSDDAFTYKGARVDTYTKYKWLRDPDGNIINVSGIPTRSSYLSKMGYSDPDFSFGFINTFTIGDFVIGVNIDGRVGGLMYNYIWDKMFDTGANPETDNQYRYDQVVNGLTNFVAPGVKVVSGSATYDKYGNITSDTRTYATNDVAVGYQSYARSLTSSTGEHGVMNETFVKLRQMSIGYSLPNKMVNKFHVKEAVVSVTGQNLLLLTGFKFSDPDIDTENLNSPSQRMIGLNIKLGL
ncbi:MAG: SusC/RagA family TonB-linked outer membrane protein [Chitinophagaceae bacterium]